MSRYFADTHFFIAVVNVEETEHDSAMAYAARTDIQYLTTFAVLFELADALSSRRRRAGAIEVVEEFLSMPNAQVEPVTPDLFERAMRLYKERPDKDWSLTDCLSFVVMQEHGITEALTGDKHFEQAGFTALLRG